MGLVKSLLEDAVDYVFSTSTGEAEEGGQINPECRTRMGLVHAVSPCHNIFTISPLRALK
jgi:hypothetical protein